MPNFGERLSNVIGPRGYDTSLRRSIQSVALFEARRILAQMEAQRTADNQVKLRAFQRKHVHWELAKAVLETTDLTPTEQLQVMWRTGTSKEPLGSETAWKRYKMIDKELKTLCDKIAPMQAAGRTHEEAIDEFIRQAFVQSGKDRTPTRSWGYSHNNCLLCYHMYFNNGRIDPSLPPARAPKVIPIPKARSSLAGSVAMQPSPARMGGLELAAVMNRMATASQGATIAAAAAAPATAAPAEDTQQAKQKETGEERRAVLEEVRQHLDILKEFEEVVPEEELNKRKRELYLALPGAPPPGAGKQARLE